MNTELQLQLQAYLDGELPQPEVQDLEARLRQDAAARDLLAELSQTKSLLAGQELPRSVPEKRQFYWSKISRQIEREAAPREAHSAPQDGWRRWLRFAFKPASGLAVTALLALMAGLFWFRTPSQNAESNKSPSLPDTQMLTFHDQQEHMTVVWLTYNE